MPANYGSELIFLGLVENSCISVEDKEDVGGLP